MNTLIWKTIVIIGVLLLACCGDRSDTQQTASNKAKELISFKGVLLGRPGGKEALKKICLEYDTNIHAGLCSFDKDALAFGLKYGNLKTKYGSTPSDYVIAEAHFDKSGALHFVQIFGDKQQLLALAEILMSKYGKPKLVKSMVENGLGAKFEKETLVWIDDEGSNLIIDSIYKTVDQGRIRISSAKQLEAEVKGEIIDKEAAKSQL